MINNIKIFDKADVERGSKAQGGKDNIFYENAMSSHRIETKIIGKTTTISKTMLQRLNMKQENPGKRINW